VTSPPIRLRRSSSFAIVVGAAACGAPRATTPAAEDRIAIVVAERGTSGIRLVAIDERGDRRFEVVQPAAQLARDTHPAISPDGAWIVFASSRGGPLERTHLWIAPLAPEAVAHPLTVEPGTTIDSHPTWLPDGSGIVFASTRGERGDYDLYRQAIAHGVAVGEPERLTSAAGHEVTPSVARDGTIYYTSITPGEGDHVDSHVEALARDGSIRRVTEGPGDAAPAISPDGRTLVFARPVERSAGTVDADLFEMPADGGAARPVIALPLTDESGAVWSRDGRVLFATSVLRGAQGNVVLSAVIAIERDAHPVVARLLEDRVGPIARLTPAIGPAPLDRRALAAAPEYLPELVRLIAKAVEHQAEAPQAPPPQTPP
jgi:dipeptidyl aminopeptidase/acylaminoacyl peptidase